MKLLTYKENSIAKLGVVASDGSIIGFESAGLSFIDMSDFIINKTAKDMEKIYELTRRKDGFEYNNIQKCAPIITPRQDIICLGINYMDHAKESYQYKNLHFDGTREEAVYFSKRVNYAVGDTEGIDPHFDVTSKLDYEVELAVIIGKDCKNVSMDEVHNYIFGYTILNDITARDIQSKHKQFYFGKSMDTFAAMGPWIVTPDEIDSENLDIKCYINDELRQSSNTSLLIFDVKYVISELSAAMTLKAGTIISMGTPSGVGMSFEPPKFLKSGDKIVSEIQGIGKITNYIM